MDIYPTLLEIAGIDLIPEQHIDGSSLSGIVRDQNHSTDRNTFFWHNPHYGNQGDSPGSAIRSGDWKLIYHYETQKAQLFNIQHDMEERYNQISQYPELAEDLQQQLNEWLRETDAKFPTTNPDTR